MSARYAIWFTPSPDGLLFSRVSLLFGRSLRKGQTFAPVAPMGIPARDWETVVAEPAFYGLHATLKAPFVPDRTSAGSGETCRERLRAALRDLCRRHHGFSTCPLVLDRLPHRNGDGYFLALTPEDNGFFAGQGKAEMRSLEKDCVLSFERFRKPLDEADIRRHGELSEKEATYLRTFGYHRIFDLFRFHLTLTGPLEEPLLSRVEEALMEHLAPLLGKPLKVDGLSLCAQDERDLPFYEVCRMSLKATAPFSTHNDSFSGFRQAAFRLARTGS